MQTTRIGGVNWSFDLEAWSFEQAWMRDREKAMWFGREEEMSRQEAVQAIGVLTGLLGNGELSFGLREKVEAKIAKLLDLL